MNKRAYHTHKISLFALVLSIFFSLNLTVGAKDVSPKRAASIAKKYVKLLQSNEVKKRTASNHVQKNMPYYIYNDAQGHGFVIVAGDDQMGEVLAYSTEGTLDTLHANPGV